MARRMCIAGNWKMNTSYHEAMELVDALVTDVMGIHDRDIVVAPPYPYLKPVAEKLAGTNVDLAAQELFYEEKGAKTGAVSGPMLASVGCKYVYVAHSERRQFFGETDETANLRVKAAFAARLVPVLCVGETLEEREAGETMAVVSRQVTGGLSGISEAQLRDMLIAYEPIWAIGTGKVATPEQAQEVHAMIRAKVAERSPEAAKAMRLLYGGSVKPGNAAELFSQEDIDGGLIGGASLKAEDFAAIVKAS